MFGSGETGQESRGCGGLYLIPPHLSLPSVVVLEISRARARGCLGDHAPNWAESTLVPAGLCRMPQPGTRLPGAERAVPLRGSIR